MQNMLIEIVGHDTYKRESVLRTVKEAVLGFDSKKIKIIIKIVDEPNEMERKAFLYPGIMINGRLLCDGRIPTMDEVRKWIFHAKDGGVVEMTTGKQA